MKNKGLLEKMSRFSKKIIGQIFLWIIAILLIGGLMNFVALSLEETKDLTPVYYLTMFSFTIAGFTLLGSVFPKKRLHEMEINMLNACRTFLISGLIFLLFIAIAFNKGIFENETLKYVVEDLVYKANPVVFFFGLLLFCLGLLQLIMDIDRYLKRVDPENN